MLLTIKNLSVRIKGQEKAGPIIADVDVQIRPNEIVAVVGASGSGKTTTGLAVMRLLDPALGVTAGKIILEDQQDLLALPASEMNRIRGSKISMVFQDQLSAFNPVLTVGYQIDEVFKYHTSHPGKRIRSMTQEWLQRVGIPEPQRVYHSYPHQLSGGMRQRAMIAMAMALQPRLIIADEPTSNLDVTLQARILELFQELRETQDVSILFITHDLGLVKRLCDRVYVMNKGRVIESGKSTEVFAAPRESYTQQLLKAVSV